MDAGRIAVQTKKEHLQPGVAAAMNSRRIKRFKSLLAVQQTAQQEKKVIF